VNGRRRKKLQQRLTEASGGADAGRVAELLRAGADPNLREDGGHGRTAAEWAELGNHRRTLDLLLGG
jgi:hypothetical protein